MTTLTGGSVVCQIKQGHRWVITEIHVTPTGEVPVGGLTARDFELIRPVTLAWLARRGDGAPVRGNRAQEPKWSDEEFDSCGVTSGASAGRGARPSFMCWRRSSGSRFVPLIVALAELETGACSHGQALERLAVR